MNNSTRVTRRRPWAWLPGAKAAMALVAIAGVAFPVAACGSNTSAASVSTNARRSAHSQSTSAERALAYSQCMRHHGVPKYPDPNSSGVIPKFSLQQIGVSSSQFQAAENDCKRLLPVGSNGFLPPAELQGALRSMVRFSQCMRSHRVPNWPDPTIGPQGKPSFDLVGIHPPIDSNSPQFHRALHACGQLVPHALGGIPVTQ